MAKLTKLLLGMLVCCISVSVFAQAYDEATITNLDKLERQRISLQKQLEVVRLEAELKDIMSKSGLSSAIATDDMLASALSLIKVTGLESNPQAVFLYSGYRLLSTKGEMVLPNLQVRKIESTHVVLKDVKSGKESILWLSKDETES